MGHADRPCDGSHVHCLSGRRARCPALPLRHRHGYAVDLHHDLPTRNRATLPESSPPSTTSRPVRTATPAHIHRVRAGQFKRLYNTGSSRTPSRLAHQARPIRQCWTDPTLSRLLPPSPATPGSGCRQLHRPATTARSGVLTSIETTAPRGAPPFFGQSRPWIRRHSPMRKKFGKLRHHQPQLSSSCTAQPTVFKHWCRMRGTCYMMWTTQASRRRRAVETLRRLDVIAERRAQARERAAQRVDVLKRESGAPQTELISSGELSSLLRFWHE